MVAIDVGILSQENNQTQYTKNITNERVEKFHNITP